MEIGSKRLGEKERSNHEKRYNMESAIFERFEAGEMGDTMDSFEWASLYELKQDLTAEIRRLEAIP